MIYLFNILIISLFCCGYYISTDNNMILNGWAKWLNKVLKGAILKPLVNCIFCYPSIWGSIIYWLLIFHLWDLSVCTETVIMWIITVFSCVYVNGCLYYLFAIMEGKSNEYKKPV